MSVNVNGKMNDAALREIGAMVAYAASRIQMQSFHDADMDFVARKHFIALTNISQNLQTLAACAGTQTPVDGVEFCSVEIKKFPVQ